MPFVISCKKQLHPGMFSAKFSWNWSSGSGEENLYISSIYFCYFIFISPQKARDPSIWKKKESSLPQIVLCQVWYKLARWFWGINIFVFSLFRYYLLLEKCWTFHLNKLKSSSPKDALSSVWLKLFQCFMRRRWKCKVYDNDGQRKNLIRKDRFSFRLKWA